MYYFCCPSFLIVKPFIYPHYWQPEQASPEKIPICARPQPEPYSIRFKMQEDLITLLSTWISARHTEAQMFYIQYDLYPSSIKVTGNQTTDLKESAPSSSVPEVL